MARIASDLAAYPRGRWLVDAIPSVLVCRRSVPPDLIFSVSWMPALCALCTVVAQTGLKPNSRLPREPPRHSVFRADSAHLCNAPGPALLFLDLALRQLVSEQPSFRTLPQPSMSTDSGIQSGSLLAEPPPPPPPSSISTKVLCVGLSSYSKGMSLHIG